MRQVMKFAEGQRFKNYKFGGMGKEVETDACQIGSKQK